MTGTIAANAVDDLAVAKRRVLRIVTRLSNPLVVCNEVLAALDETLGYKRGCIVMRHKPGEPLAVIAHSRDHRAANDQVREIMRVEHLLNLAEPGVIARVIETGRPIIVNYVPSEPAYHEGALEMMSEACVPLIDRAVCVGALNVESPARGRFGEADRLFLETVAALVTPALLRLPLARMN